MNVVRKKQQLHFVVSVFQHFTPSCRPKEREVFKNPGVPEVLKVDCAKGLLGKPVLHTNWAVLEKRYTASKAERVCMNVNESSASGLAQTLICNVLAMIMEVVIFIGNAVVIPKRTRCCDPCEHQLNVGSISRREHRLSQIMCACHRARMQEPRAVDAIP